MLQAPNRIPNRLHAGFATTAQRWDGHGALRASDRTDRREPMWPEGANHEAGVIYILHALGMPTEDVRALVAADDPVVVHRYIELHGERVAERLADQLKTLVRLEQNLKQAILDHGTTSRSSRRLSPDKRAKEQ